VEWLRVKALNSSPSTTGKKKVKWTASESQVIEHLLCKCETLQKRKIKAKDWVMAQVA
jgi:hypothetical protein